MYCMCSPVLCPSPMPPSMASYRRAICALPPMIHGPLDDESLDVAIFSLSLIGANFSDYLREAHRTLKLDGQLHIIEATERFNDRNEFAKGLETLGFAVVSVEDKWKFTHIRAIKTERQPRGG